MILLDMDIWGGLCWGQSGSAEIGSQAGVPVSGGHTRVPPTTAGSSPASPTTEGKMTKPAPDEIICEQCLEPFPETEIILTDEDLPVCRRCNRDLRRSDRNEKTRRLRG